MKIDKKQIIYIIISSISIILVAGLGSLFVNLGMSWFNSLNKPSQWIPNIVIPIVWTIIYISFGIINFFWIKNEMKIPKNTVILMIVNSLLNVLWCLIFFTLQQTFLGNIIILLNLIAGIILWINIFYQNKLYSYILSLYPIWLTIATTLNISLWIIN